jgi:hypothetical protein
MIDFDKLATFPSIGWDFDKTLVDSEASPHLHRFITEHPDIKHYIVTFRTHGLVQSIPFDLRVAGAPPLNRFSGVLSIPEQYWVDNESAMIDRKHGILTGPLTEEEIAYKTWKGFICKQNSIPILIDDDTANTAMACEKYSILLVDPLNLIPYESELFD